MSKSNKVHNVGTLGWYASVYRRAAKHIDNYGWVKYRRGNPESGFCAIGAIEYEILTRTPTMTLMQMHTQTRTPMRTLELSSALYGDGRGALQIVNINDLQCKSKYEIVRFLRGIAYMCDHGNKLPRWAEKIKAARDSGVAQNQKAQEGAQCPT